MRREKFTEFMRHPEKVGSDDLQELEALVNQYPYFQAARTLYLKVLYLQAGSRFRHELKTSTVHITDHKHLLQYLNLLPGTHLRDVKSGTNDTTTETEVYTQNGATSEAEDSLDTTTAEPIVAENEEESIVSLNFEDIQGKTTKAPKQPKPRHIPNIEPLPLDLDSDESEETENTFTIPEIISAGYSLADDEDSSTPASATTQNDKNSQLIDNFIKSNPSIPKPTESEVDTRDLSEENPYANDELLTETLAKIYTKQKLYEKAITTYIKLSLKYPEKSVYFANRIDKIKEIINNQE